ncbi:MAG: hypothetical protein H6742_19760 [Alphaproteobacteria bacterium]|nr:hypothetical protein [Alphaproteobacteria bacterium]
MNDALAPVRAAVQTGQRFLFPVSLVNLLVGAAIAVLDSSIVWRFFGFVLACVGVVFLVAWARGRDSDRHPLMQVLRETPDQVRFVHRTIERSPIGRADRAVLHVALADGQHFSLPVEDPALAEQAAQAILAVTPSAERLPDETQG